MSYVTRYPNEPDESFDQFDVTVDQIEDVEIDKPINDIHLEVGLARSKRVPALNLCARLTFSLLRSSKCLLW
jgi:hypothetical protein